MLSSSADAGSAFMKGPKRKRLAKACDACHKSKRRCDGTAPCSNCYYASKQCTYTDASGRPVPAPRPFKPDRQDAQPSTSTDSRPYPPSQLSPTAPTQFRIFPNPAPAPPQYQNDSSDDDNKHPRKRFRNQRGNPTPVDDLIIDGPILIERPPSIELDPSLTRELTNLFFTHCHPARAVLHKPTFASSLSHNRVPSHLLLAVCALAAPLSKQPLIRTTPSRFAGKPFAHEALSQMFDPSGRLIVEPDLATAQALCILQMHDILTKPKNSLWSNQFHDLALQIVQGLGVHSPEIPTLTPVPSQEFVQGAIEREAIRRIFWLIHTIDINGSIYFKQPATFSDIELRLRLPVDETSFELGVHSTLPEYLYLPAVRTQYASEFGHLIRILSIYSKMECALDEANDSESKVNTSGALMEAEQKMKEWDRTLPEHLRFSEQSLQVQQSMFETSSNTGAWSWCCIHVYHASCALAFYLANQRNQREPRFDPPAWAVEKIELTLKMLGDRAKNSILMGSALWSLIKYCKRDDPQVRKWSTDYEEATGTKMFEMVQDWRSQPSPPQQHQYPPASHSQPQHQQPSHNHVNTYNSQHQVSHRRLSDVRNSTAQHNFGPSSSNSNSSRPPIHQHATDTSSYAGTTSETHVIMKRSPSNSPPMSYPLGRPPNSVINSNSSNNNHNRNATVNQHSSSSNSSGGGRDGRGQPSAGQNNPHARWLHPAGESLGGSSGDGMQVGFSGSTGDVNGGSKGPGAAVSNGTGAQRNFGEGSQSLPSLKASGLLDSWGSSGRNVGEGPKQMSNGTSQQPQLAVSPRRTPPNSISLSITAPSHHPALDVPDLRPPTTLAMPVGLQWLANESR